MLIDSDIHPERNIYYIGAKQLDLICNRKRAECDIQVLFNEYNKSNNVKISFDYHLLALDWLYILGIVDIGSKGNLILCI